MRTAVSKDQPATCREHRYGRSFRYLWLGTGASAIGSAVSDVALPLLAVLLFDASAGFIAVLIAVEQAPMLLFGLLAGAWADRWPLRRLMVGCDLGRAVVIGTVPAAAFLGMLTAFHLYVVAVIVGSLAVVRSVSSVAVLPTLVSRDALVSANGALSSTTTASDLCGHTAGGVLVQLLGAPATLLVDAASCLMSAVCLRHLPSGSRNRPVATGRSLLGEIGEGLRINFRDPILRVITTVHAIWNLCIAAQYALTLIFLVQVLNVSPALAGVLLAASGLGGAAGAVASSRLVTRYGAGLVWRNALVAAAASGLLIPAAFSGTGLLLFVLGSVGLAAGGAVATVVGSSVRQAWSPPAVLGRVAATSRVVTWGAITIGALLAGGLATAIGIREALWVIGGALLAAPVLAWRSARRIPPMTEMTAAKEAGPSSLPERTSSSSARRVLATRSEALPSDVPAMARSAPPPS